MQTLYEYNTNVQHINSTTRVMAGVSCPVCDKQGKQNEMFLPNPNMVLTCNPPKQTVECPECKFIGYKYY
jgi:hypothetical protein